MNQRPIDLYTVAHAGWGMAARAAGLSFPLTVAASIIFETFLEPRLKQARPDVFPWPSQDSRTNSAIDTAAVAAGWYCAKRIGRKALPIAVSAIAAPVIADPAMRKLLTGP